MRVDVPRVFVLDGAFHPLGVDIQDVEVAWIVAVMAVAGIRHVLGSVRAMDEAVLLIMRRKVVLIGVEAIEIGDRRVVESVSWHGTYCLLLIAYLRFTFRVSRFAFFRPR